MVRSLAMIAESVEHIGILGFQNYSVGKTKNA